MKIWVSLCLLVLVLGLSSCQRDDLCGENFQVTPRLNIEFYDFTEPEELKSYSNLVLINDRIADTIAFDGGNSISIPLATGADQTTFRLIKNVGTEEPQEDTLKFTYSRRNNFVNRPCGFKQEYIDLQAQVLDNDNRWIENTNVRKSVIRSDENIHLFIFH